MPHLNAMRWDQLDRLQATTRQVVNNGGTPETTYYVYDNSGKRVRKVTERPLKFLGLGTLAELIKLIFKYIA
jgi:hypothetical protein